MEESSVYTLYSDTFANETVYSDHRPVTIFSGFCISVDVAGTSIVGTCSIEVSLDGTNFAEISSQSFSAAEHFIFNVPNAYYRCVRVKLVSSDADTVTGVVKFVGKGE